MVYLIELFSDWARPPVHLIQTLFKVFIYYRLLYITLLAVPSQSALLSETGTNGLFGGKLFSLVEVLLLLFMFLTF